MSVYKGRHEHISFCHKSKRFRFLAKEILTLRFFSLEREGEWRVYDMPFLLVTRILNSKISLVPTAIPNNIKKRQEKFLPFFLKKTFLVFMSESLHISSFKADRPTDHRKFLWVFYIKELWAIICRWAKWFCFSPVSNLSFYTSLVPSSSSLTLPIL